MRFAMIPGRCDHCRHPIESEAKAVFADDDVDLRTLCEVCQKLLPPGTKTLRPEARRV